MWALLTSMTDLYLVQFPVISIFLFEARFYSGLHNQRYLNEIFYPVHNDFYFYFKGRRDYNIFPYVLGKWELKSGVTSLQCSFRRVLKALGKRRAEKDTAAFYRYGRWLKQGEKSYFH